MSLLLQLCRQPLHLRLYPCLLPDRTLLTRAVLNRLEPERTLYLAVRDITFNSLFEEPIGKLLVETENLRILVFEATNEVIVRWIS